MLTCFTMGCLRLDILQKAESPLKVVYRKSTSAQKVVQSFMSVDPLADKMPAWSPYSYAANNPIKNIDVDGLFPWPGDYAKWTLHAFGKAAKGFGMGVLHGMGAVTQLGNPHVAANAERLGNHQRAAELRNEFNDAVATVAVDALIGYGASKAIKGLGSLKVFTNTGKTFKSSSIRFSQSTVNNYSRAAKNLNDPIDIVKMQDGMYTTVDNTRLLAAQNQGVDISANVHAYDDILPDTMLDRFANPNVKGEYAKTWGEAVEFRTNSQNAQFRKDYGGTGTFVQPNINSY